MGEKTRVKAIPEEKKKLVEDLVKELKESKTVLIASTRGLPSSQFNEIKKQLRGKADVRVIKKSALLRALARTEKGALQNLKEHIKSDVAIFFSSMDPFELSVLLEESQGPAKAKAGDVAPEDISVEPGPTDLVPGPAISELSGVGLKVAVEEGKLAIRVGAIIAKAGQIIKENVASVMGKLGITPMRVGFEPLVAYDSVTDKIYVGIKVNKKEKLAELKTDIGKAFGFAVNLGYTTPETIKFILAKAGLQEKALEKIVNDKSTKEESK